MLGKDNHAPEVKRKGEGGGCPLSFLRKYGSLQDHSVPSPGSPTESIPPDKELLLLCIWHCHGPNRRILAMEMPLSWHGEPSKTRLPDAGQHYFPNEHSAVRVIRNQLNRKDVTPS